MGLSRKGAMRTIFALIMFLAFISCASTQHVEKTDDMPAPEPIEEDMIVESRVPAPEVPEFVPAKDASSPLQTRVVSIAARNTPLRDVLYTIAETANLNLVIERGVEPDLPVTMTFKDLGIEDALNIVFDSVDYFYKIKNNILIAKAAGTEVFELGQPNIIQEYETDVGGDILNGTSSDIEGVNAISGDVSVTSKSDTAAFQFWDAIENTLSTLLLSGNNEQEGAVQANFIVNRMTGTIMVTSTKEGINKVRTYIDNLKKVLNRQVLIEARIVEVQLSEELKYGIDWEVLARFLNEDMTIISARGFTDIFSAGTPSFEVNILDADDFTFLLKALERQGDVQTLSNPRVNIMNGQTSMLSVGRNKTFISRVESDIQSSDGDLVTTFSVETSSILSGIMFGLVPYIDSNREVTMTITPILSNLVELEPQTIGTDAIEIQLPTVDLREMSTTVKVLDGQLIVIGGLIDKQEILRENKIPILGDVPVIGGLFKSVDKTYENKELVIMLIPRVIS